MLGPRVLVYRLLPSGKRTLCFLAPTFELAWVYYLTSKRRKRDGRVWVAHEHLPAVVPRCRPESRKADRVAGYMRPTVDITVSKHGALVVGPKHGLMVWVPE
jgi:hypothetical protein